MSALGALSRLAPVSCRIGVKPGHAVQILIRDKKRITYRLHLIVSSSSASSRPALLLLLLSSWRQWIVALCSFVAACCAGWLWYSDIKRVYQDEETGGVIGGELCRMAEQMEVRKWKRCAAMRCVAGDALSRNSRCAE